MNENIPNIHVGIVGGTQSGKTLYISCLQRFIDNNFDGITFGGADVTSSDWLKGRTAALNQGQLPEATSVDKKNDLRFILRDNEERQIEIKILDRRGGDYQEKPDSELIEFLSACTGFIILVDPLRTLDEQSGFYRPLFETLSNHLRENNSHKRKRFSICLTKIDDPVFWSWYLTIEKTVMKIVNEESRAEVVFKAWFRAQDNVEDFTKPLGITFGRENIKYHLISSIGFCETNSETKSTNLANLLSGGETIVGHLRSGKKYCPVNLYKPLYWAMGGDL